MLLRSHTFRRRFRHQTPVIKKLTAGFARFQKRWYKEEELFQTLQNGQNPHALLIACSDSRVDPVLLTNSRPGDLFVVRNVANVVPAYAHDSGSHGVSAAIEYAVKHLHVTDIIVMGHACCGGIKALMDSVEGNGFHMEEDEFIGPWVSLAKNAVEHVLATMPRASKEDKAYACELANVRLSLDSLITFPWIKSRVEGGLLTLHGWYFDLRNGELLEYDSKQETFLPLVGRIH